MSLEKAIKHNKEKRKPYHGSKAFDCTCRNHGSCSWCVENRTLFDKKARMRLDGQEEEYFCYWNQSDPCDATETAYDERLKEIGIDLWDFKTRRELDV